MPVRVISLHRWRTITAALSALVLLLGCNLTRMGEALPLADDPPTPTPSAPTPDDGWTPIRPGVARREDTIGGGGLFDARAIVVRLDPALVTFEVAYSPGAPRTLAEWRAALPDALLIVNGAFFDPQNTALGLVVSDGQAYGQSLAGFGGMFQVTETGPRVRSLVSEPYAGETLWQAVQAFPMLVESGGVAAPRGDGFDEPARRTIIAQDRAGRILIAVTPLSEASFATVQDWLLTADLDVAIAFALDGGRSTGMILDLPDAPDEQYPAFDSLPSVIAVYPR